MERQYTEPTKQNTPLFTYSIELIAELIDRRSREKKS